MSFAEIADQRFLRSAQTELGELHWDVEPDGFLRIDGASDLDGVLTFMVRRGLAPSLVTTLFEIFPQRPIERALLAWDVLRGSLLGTQERDVVERLVSEIAPLRQLGATRTVAIARERVPALIDAVRPSGDLVALMDDFLTTPSLSALVALTVIHDQLESDDTFVAMTMDHARQLALAHLPSLALAFLQILWDRFAPPSALELLIEIALDYELYDAIPQLADDDVSLQRQAYIDVRRLLAAYNVLRATVVLQNAEDAPAVRDTTYPPLLLAKAELELLKNKRFDAATLQAIGTLVPSESLWRYGVRVRDSIELHEKAHLAVITVEGFIPRFGNDARIWRRAGRHRGIRPALLTLLSRELRYVGHDPEVWRVLGFFSRNADPIDAEIDQRLAEQLDSALGSAT